MAESMRDKSSRSCSNSSMCTIKNDSMSNIECAVCLQTSVHPAELPCGHIFCYLCIKGIVNQGRRCAMCRQDIPVDYLDKPRLLKPVDVDCSNKGFDDGQLWFYEGHNGWWQYDERTSLELEAAYQKGERCCELLIAGFLYVADFDTMMQYRRNDPSRRRRIKRDLATITTKGVAGLKTAKDSNSTIPNPPDMVSNVLIPDLQSLHISGLENTHGNSSNPEPASHINLTRQIVSQSDARSPSRNLPSLSQQLICSSVSTNSNTHSPPDNSGELLSRSFDLDSAIHDTLDWTIEQIESLNLELTNDYENLFRDVSNYGQLTGVLDSNRTINLTRDGPHRSQVTGQSESDSQSTDRSRGSNDESVTSARANTSDRHAPVATSNSTSRVESRTGSRLPHLTGTDTSGPVTRSRGSSQNGCRKMSSTQL